MCLLRSTADLFFSVNVKINFHLMPVKVHIYIILYRVRHKSVNTPFIPRRTCWRPSRWRPWHPCHAFLTALPPTTIYCEPGAYDMPFVGWRGVNRLMPHRGVNRLMPHPVYQIIVLFYVLFVLCCSVYCLCVNVYCTAATGWQPNCS